MVHWHPPAPTTVHYAAIALAALALAALIEATVSFNRFPFSYGHRCGEIRPLTTDGWTQGAMLAPVPAAAVSAELILVADRPDLDRRSLEVGFSVLSGSGSPVEIGRHSFIGRDSNPRWLQFPLPNPTSRDATRYLQLKPSHCYVPLNFGVSYDPRRLGVRVKALRYRTAEGVEIP
jgi:hypothetical protein